MPNISDLTFPQINSSFNWNIADLLQYGNVVTGDMFGIMILIALFFITFISTRAKPSQAFSTACFITTLASYFFMLLHLVALPTVVTLTILSAISVFFLFSFND